jgi:hypothetical protein
MKKLLIVLLALSVLGIFAVAQDAPAASLSVGAWGRGYYIPFASDDAGSTNYVSAGPSWGGYGARVGVSFTGTSENVGFAWNPGVSGTTMNAVCDNALIWVKLNPMVKVVIGKAQEDALRGKLGDFGDYLSQAGNDAIFQRFYPNAGMILELTPADGIFIAAALDSSAPADTSALKDLLDVMVALGAMTQAQEDATLAAMVAPSTTVSDAFKAIQVGAGYTIADVGQVRFQYIGTANTVTKGKIQAAFNYTGMAGLGLDVGVTYPLNSDFQTVVALGARYSMDALSLALQSANSFMGATGSKFTTQTMAQIEYLVAAPYAVGADAGINGMTAAGAKGSFDVMPYVKAGFDKGFLKVGFAYKAGLDTGAKAKYAIPVELQYGF